MALPTVTTTLSVHSAPITCCRLTTHRRLVCGTDSGEVSVSDVENAQTLQSFSAHTQAVTGLDVDRQGQYAATCSWDKTCRVWPLQASTEDGLTHTMSHNDWLRGVSISLEGRVLTAAANGSVFVWDATTGTMINEWKGHKDWVQCVRASHQVPYLAASSAWDRTIRIWDSRCGEPCVRVFEGHKAAAKLLNFAHEELSLVSGSSDGSVRVWDLSASKQRYCFEHESHVTALATFPGHVASGCSSGLITIHDLDTGQLAFSYDKHAEWITDLAAAPDGTILSCSGDAQVQAWRYCRSSLPGNPDDSCDGQASKPKSSAEGSESSSAPAASSSFVLLAKSRPRLPALCCAAGYDDEATVLAYGCESGDAGTIALPSGEANVSPIAAEATEPQTQTLALGNGEWFLKRGGWRKTGGVALTGRKRRWCTLHGQELRYYASVQGGIPQQQKGSIQLSKDTTVETKGARLLIHTTDRTWDLEASDPGIAADWSKRLQEAIGLLQSGVDVPQSDI